MWIDIVKFIWHSSIRYSRLESVFFFVLFICINGIVHMLIKEWNFFCILVIASIRLCHKDICIHTCLVLGISVLMSLTCPTSSAFTSSVTTMEALLSLSLLIFLIFIDLLQNHSIKIQLLCSHKTKTALKRI